MYRQDGFQKGFHIQFRCSIATHHTLLQLKYSFLCPIAAEFHADTSAVIRSTSLYLLPSCTLEQLLDGYLRRFFAVANRWHVCFGLTQLNEFMYFMYGLGLVPNGEKTKLISPNSRFQILLYLKYFEYQCNM